MKIEFFKNEKGGCGGGCGSGAGSSHLILGGTVSKEMLSAILGLGSFAEVEYQTKAGILYVESKALVISGAFGRNRLVIKCKFAIPARTQECIQQSEAVLGILRAME
jgi:hypothetical protein